jgi:hypothetical protein
MCVSLVARPVSKSTAATNPPTIAEAYNAIHKRGIPSAAPSIAAIQASPVPIHRPRESQPGTPSSTAPTITPMTTDHASNQPAHAFHRPNRPPAQARKFTGNSCHRRSNTETANTTNPSATSNEKPDQLPSIHSGCLANAIMVSAPMASSTQT